jgi:condensin-2 complex subunit H2
VHHSGALLLEARDGFMLDEFLRPISGGIAAKQLPTAFPLAPAAAPPTTGVEEPQDPQDDGFDDVGDMGDYFGGEGSDFPMDDASPLPNGSPGAEATEAQVGEEQQELTFDDEEEEEEEFDPYEPLDPSDARSMLSKPFKKYSRLPTKPKMRAAQQPPPGTALTDGLLLLPAPATGLLFPEFHYALRQSQLEDAREARKLSREVAAARQNKKPTVPATAVFTMQEAEAAMAAAAGEDEDDLLGGENDFDPGFFDEQIDAGMPDDDDFEGAFADAGGGNDWGGGGGPLSDLLNENGGSDGDISYEDLCRAHVESLISAAAAAEVQTELASRVSTWRMKMAPVLEEEDARPEFDIHFYGERILQGLAQLSVAGTTENIQQNEVEEEAENPVSRTKDKKSSRDAKNENTDSAPALTGPVIFDQVVTGAEIQNDYDVPRLFSSMLQLVNNGNLRVLKINDSSDNFKISLLSTELKHKRIEAYLAPSSAAAEAEVQGQSMHQAEEVAEESRVVTTAVKKPASKRRKA